MTKHHPKSRNPFTFEELNEHFSYDPDTGYIHYRDDGRRADWKNHTYQRIYTGFINPDRPYCQAHRVAWLLHTGAWPKEQIDHINGDGHDNRLHNIREATATQNLRNRSVFKNNKLGVKGVCQVSPTRFRAQLWKDGKFILSKHFKTIAEASAAYEAAALEAFGAFHRKSAPIGPRD